MADDVIRELRDEVPTETQDTDDSGYIKFRDTIAELESSGNVRADNPNSSAKGLYQFTDFWTPKGGWIEKTMGKSYKDILPKDESPEETKRSKEEQDELFRLYNEDQLEPQADDIMKLDEAADYTRDEIKFLIHFKGHPEAKEWVKSGEDSPNTAEGNQYNNPTVDKYLAKFRSKMEEEAPEEDLSSIPPSEEDAASREDWQIEKDYMRGELPVDMSEEDAEWAAKADDMFGDLDETYTVKSGDTLYDIAERYNMDMNELAEMNDIDDPDVISVDQELIIKSDEEDDLDPDIIKDLKSSAPGEDTKAKSPKQITGVN
jgi:nucleoid-associated protein YgaU